ncbi:MAG: hypothetical protein V3U26_05600 [Dehalococcoidia bacterium]
MTDSGAEGSLGYFLDLTREDVRRLARAHGLHIDDVDLDEVRLRLTGLAEVLGWLDPKEMAKADPLPIIIPGEDS